MRADDQLANDEVSLNGLDKAAAIATITDWLVEHGHGEATTTYKLRDWLFSRRRYWGEPFPIVYDENDLPVAVPHSMLPVLLPEVDDYSPKTFADDDADSAPEPPLSRATEWTTVELDLGDGRRSTGARPTRCPTGPVRAGTTCATWTRATTSRWSTPSWRSTGWARGPW